MRLRASEGQRPQPEPTGLDSLSSQDQAAGMDWLLRLLLNEQVPIRELTPGGPFSPT